jgi:hypothetical protein
MQIDSPLILEELNVSGSANISGSLTVGFDILPNVPDQISIGSETNRFKDIYLSGSTIYLGNVKISESEEGTLQVVDASEQVVVVGEVDTGSIDLRLDALELESGSVRRDFNSYTSSADLRLDSLETESGSVRTELNNYTSSIDTKISSLEEESGSIRLALNNFTGSSGVISGSTQFDNLNDPFTGSFTGSFTGDGAGLTGIAASLAISGSTGSDTIDLKTSALTFAGDNGVTTAVTDDTLTISIPQGTVSASSQVDHNTTTNYIANEHIDHSTVNITAGEGISGGGDITTSRTLTLNTGSAHFTEGVKTKLNSDLIVSGSDVQVKTFLSLNNVDNTADVDKPLSTAQKLYVDEVAQGLKARSSARVLVDSNLNATYDNGVEGSGSFLESNTNGAFPTTDGIDSEELNIINTRILVIGQTNKAHNGLYVLQTPGDSETPWKIRRCRECDSSQEIPGSYIFVKSGTIYGNTGWVMLVDNPATFTIGTDNINPQQFSGAGSFLAGNGLGLDGNIFSLDTGSVHFNTGVKTKLNIDGVISGSGQISINSTNGTLNVDKGGTGQTSYTDGQLLIGSNGSLSKGTLAGTTDRIIVTNGAGSITINADATNANTANKIVARDASGNFSAGTITATLSGNATTATTATTANATTQAVTFNNGGSGAASGTTFNGGTARTISYNTIGAPSTTGTNASGTWGISITGNAATATTLQTARTIGGVSFNGSANINLPGVNTAGNQNTSGNAATATILATTRSINGTNFNGSANITTANWGTARNINGTSIDGSTNYAIGRIYDTNYRRFTNPGGGEYVTTASSVTGAIEVVFPNTFSNGMYKLVIEVYEYITNRSFTVYAAGHTSGTLWYNTTAYIIGNPGLDRRFNVRFGRNAANRAVVYIGETNSTWSYPQVFLTEFQCGYAGFQDNSAGWAINFRTATLENVSQTVSNCQIGYAVSTNTANSVVQRDASGNFSAGTITATLSGTASNATTAGGLQIHTGRNNEANKIVRTDVNGYIQAGWINTTSGDRGTTAPTRIYASNDEYIRYYTPANFRQVLDLPTRTGGNASGTWGINITGNAGSASSVAWGNVSSKPSNIMYYQGFTLDANTMDSNSTGFTYSVNAPATGPIARFSAGGGYDLWLNAAYGASSNLFFRTRNGDNGTLNPWRALASYGINYGDSLFATIYYDSNNTAFYIDPTSNSELSEIYATGWFRNRGDRGWYSQTYGYGLWWPQPGGNSYGNVTTYGTGRNGWDGYGIQSRWAFMGRSGDVGLHDNNLGWVWYWNTSFTNFTLGYTQFAGSARAPIFYDSNDTTYYMDYNSTTSGRLRGNLIFNDYGAGVIGTYDSTRYQAVFSMGSAYVLPINGTGVGNLYGIAWSHPNAGGAAGNLASHGMLILENGAFRGAWGGGRFVTTSDVRGTIYYDYNNTGYYIDPNATTAIRTVGSWRADSATWDGEFAGKLQYHSNNWYFQFNSNILFRNSGGTNVLTCDSSGNLTTTANITAYSDIRLKENISTIKNGLELVNKLRGVTFNWKDTGNYSYGLIAQEVEEIIPELVLETETGTLEGEASNKIKSVDYSKITAVLIEAIKEQQHQLDTYKSELEELKTLLTTRGK